MTDWKISLKENVCTNGSRLYAALTDEITMGETRMGWHRYTLTRLPDTEYFRGSALLQHAALQARVSASEWHRVIAIPQVTICSRRSDRNCYKSLGLLANIDPACKLAAVERRVNYCCSKAAADSPNWPSNFPTVQSHVRSCESESGFFFFSFFSYFPCDYIGETSFRDWDKCIRFLYRLYSRDYYIYVIIYNHIYQQNR